MSGPAPAFPAHLAVVTSGYPAPACPTSGMFVRQFAHAVARQGVACTVVHPVARHHAWRGSGYPLQEREDAGSGRSVEVYRPRFLSFSARDAFSVLGPLNPSLWTFNRFTAAARRVLERLPAPPAALYGHFLYLSGAAAVRVGRRMGIPAFPCMGEGELWTVRRFGLARARADLSPAAGFLANSSALKRTLIRELGLPAEKIGVFPNGTNLSAFQPMDRNAARAQLGLPQDRSAMAVVAWNGAIYASGGLNTSYSSFDNVYKFNGITINEPQASGMTLKQFADIAHNLGNFS